MRIRLTEHALSRMKEYDTSESEVLAAIAQPDKVVQLRGSEDLIVVVTAHRARRERYE